jgi:hypothetical protein
MPSKREIWSAFEVSDLTFFTPSFNKINAKIWNEWLFAVDYTELAMREEMVVLILAEKTGQR